jgi:uncharacterized damage-inducible protein DinB
MKNHRMLMRYNAWANRQIFAAMAALPEGEAVKERPSLCRNMVHTMNHIFIVAEMWRAHLTGRKHEYTALNTPDHPPLEELARREASLAGWYIEYADSLSDAALQEVVSFTLIGGNQGQMTREQILFHLVNHSSYHRGFVADMFFQVPERPPLMDMTVFLRETSAAR